MAFAWDGVTLAFELAFGFTFADTNPTWTDVTEYVDGFTVRGGRSSLLGQFQGRQSVWRLDNSDDRFDPSNTSSPYDPDVVLGVPARFTVTHSTNDYVLFRGIVEAWPQSYTFGVHAAVDLPLADGVKILNRRKLNGDYSAQTTDERIEAILDEVGWPSTLRDLDSGVASVPAATLEDVTALEHIEAVADAEVGYFFIAADGNATFRNRVAVSGGEASQATFGPGVGEHRYEQVDVTYDDTDVYNTAEITPDDDSLAVQIAIDQPAIDALGYRSTISRTIPAENEAHALNVAEWLVGRHKDTRPRIRALAFAPNVADNWPQALGIDLREAVTVKVSPPNNGTDLEQVCVVENISHRAMGGGKWLTTWELYPLSDLEQEDFWILGTSELGTETNLA